MLTSVLWEAVLIYFMVVAMEMMKKRSLLNYAPWSKTS
jgi:predicted HTH domain antitoxin